MLDDPAYRYGDMVKARDQTFDVRIDGAGSHVFDVPAGVSFVRLLTERRVLLPDTRELGAMIRAISVDGRPIPLSDPSLVDGFHENEGTHRWTNGRGVLPVLMSSAGRVVAVEVASVAKELEAASKARSDPLLLTEHKPQSKGTTPELKRESARGVERKRREGSVSVLRTFQIDPVPVQQLLPAAATARFEGLGYSSCGRVLGAATADTNEALLFRRGPDGRFENAPFCTLSDLKYPHDISFMNSGDADLVAVAQRKGAVTLFEFPTDASTPARSFEISGPEAKLDFTDAVAFAPGINCVAACNLSLGTVSFYRVLSGSPVRTETSPCYELKHPAMHDPDGIGFSNDGAWLASANHGGNSVTIFARALTSNGPIYGPEPVATIQDDDFRYPHSVAFTENGHVVVTNAGANYIKVYRLSPGAARKKLSVEPLFKMAVNDEATFHEVNSHNKMEGGPKGLAVHGDELAVCSPEFGIKIFRFSEYTPLGKLKRLLLG